MKIEAHTLARIVIELPEAAAILRRFDLDYLHKGDLSLKEACQEKGVSLPVICGELESARSSEDLTSEELSPAEIAVYISERYHRRLRLRLPELLQLAQLVEKEHAGKKDFPSGLLEQIKTLASELFTHLDKEEQVLFPLIQNGQLNFVKAPITRMEFEHEQQSRHFQKLKELTNDFSPPEDASANWINLYQGLEKLERELMDTIHLENNILFPLALNALVP